MKTNPEIIELSRRYVDLFCAVYIMTNTHHTVLYVGVTNNLPRRILEHKGALNATSFTSKYQTGNLVYFERHESITTSIQREKQIKGGSRAKKIALIESVNPDWNDLSSSVLQSATTPCQGVASSSSLRSDSSQ